MKIKTIPKMGDEKKKLLLKNIPGKELQKLIAKRLKDIRLELKSNDPKYTQIFVAKEIGSTQKAISRMEIYDSSLFVLNKVTLIKLLIYYNSLGYNIEWIIQPHNTKIEKYILSF